MPNEQLVPLHTITIPRKRMRTANNIEGLAASIHEQGLLHPITLRRDGERLILVAGHRRLQAIRLLRREDIPAYILDIDEVRALLIEIDENLQRAELTELQRAQHLAERKRVWESLHPETKHGGTPGNTGQGRGKKPRTIKVANFATLIPRDDEVSKPPIRSFVEEAAEILQKAPRTVRVSTRIGQQIVRAAQDLVEGTRIEDNQHELLRLAAIPDHAMQVAVATLIHDGKETSVVRAQRRLEANDLAATPPPLPTGPFRVLVVDPPWSYDKRPADATKRENITYATMDIDTIKALPVPTLAEDNAILWLWTTNAHLPQAFGIVEAWGFTYKTLLTWDKMRPGMGEWLRGQTEHCLLCIRGNVSVALTTETTLLSEMRTRHSKKPAAFYALVESLCPGSKVELFARVSRTGWAVWGNMETESDSKPDTQADTQQMLLA